MNSPYSKESFYKLKKMRLLIYLFLPVLGLCCCVDFLVAVSRGSCLGAVLRILIVMLLLLQSMALGCVGAERVAPGL